MTCLKLSTNWEQRVTSSADDVPEVEHKLKTNGRLEAAERKGKTKKCLKVSTNTQMSTLERVRIAVLSNACTRHVCSALRRLHHN
jgi:hypothetical protein